MSANDLLGWLIQFSFIFLGVITATDYFRHRDQTRGDIGLMFGSLAISFLIQATAHFIGPHPRFIDTLGTMALIAQPYFLLRLLRYFRPIPLLLMRAALIGLLLFWVALIFAEYLSTLAATIGVFAMIIYFAAVDGYAMFSFVKAMLSASGVARQRLRFAAAGSGLLAVALLGLGFAALITPLKDLITTLILLAAIASAFAYYIGFAPPRWLRRAWQLTELRQFLLRISIKPIGARLNVGEGLDDLCQSAYLAVGGIAAAVAEPNGTGGQWMVRHASDRPELLNFMLEGSKTIPRVWQERRPQYTRITDILNENERRLLETVQAETLLIAPIAASERSWGLLLVFLSNNSLFVDDDLDLMMLLAQQSAVFLENNTLVEEMHHYSEQLEVKVTERTKELEASREEYRRLLETAQEGIWVTNAENQTTYVNARMAEMLGYTTEELMTSPLTTFLSETDRALAAANQQRRREGIKENFEFKFQRKDGSDLFVLVAATPQTNESGVYTGSLAMVADITERKRAEAEILKLNAELEQRVIERTAQLSLVNRELEAFSYSVSHDLRAPLRTLDGFSQILIENYQDCLDEKGQHFLQRIRAGSENMGQLIDALLHLARISRAELRSERVNLSALARVIQAELQEQNPDRHIQWKIADDLVVTGDRGLLRVVLTNLLGNAYKFTRKQPDAIIEFGSTEQEGKPAYFVRDNGAGFDMSYASHLFGAFQRLHHASEFEGTGIGLATVERIIHRHNGRIWAEAAVNQGATFYFTLQA